jgi:hypothetical protein
MGVAIDLREAVLDSRWSGINALLAANVLIAVDLRLGRYFDCFG